MGAVHGLANSSEATSVGAGLATGAAGELNAEQQQKNNHLASDANNRANQEADAQQVQMALNTRMLSHKLHLMDSDSPEYVQQQVGKLADDGDAAIKAGALIKSPTFDTAAELEQFTHDNHYAAGNFQVRPTPYHDPSGKIRYALVEAGDAPTTQDTQITYAGPDGKQATAVVPAGTPKSKLAQFQVAAAHQQVDGAFKQWQQTKKEQHATTVVNKAQQNYGYAEDKDGNTVLTNQFDAAQAGQQFQPVKPAQIASDRNAIRLLGDVQLNSSRYTKAASDYATANLSPEQKDVDRTSFATLLTSAGWWDAEASISSGGHISLPVITAFTEAASKLRRSDDYTSMSPQGKEMFDSFVRTTASLPAYQRALSGSSRSNKETLELELQNIPNPSLATPDVIRKLGQWQENLNTISQGYPKLPGIKSPKDIRESVETPTMSPELQRMTSGAFGGKQ
jgi:hypothetical protein